MKTRKSGKRGGKFKVHPLGCIPNWRLFCTALLVLGIATGSSQAQGDAQVVRASVRTPDSLVVEISVSRGAVTRGSDIRVNYSITNLGTRTYYQVLKAVPEIVVKDLWVIEVLKPASLPDEHKPFDFRFVSIPGRKSIKGSFEIDSGVYESNKDYEFENAAIRVAFSFLTDVSPFKGCTEQERRFECLQVLDRSAHNLRVGDLVVEIVDR